MALSVKVNLEAYPEGIPLGFVGMGVVENGGTLEVDPAMEEVFYSINGDTIENVTAEQEGLDVSGSAEFTPETEEEVPTPEPPSAPDPEPQPPTDPEPTQPISGLPGGDA